MSVPLDLSLINQLLNEQRTQGDLNNLTKSGFFYVLWPTNTPNDRKNSCHVINLVNYSAIPHTAENMRIFQMHITDTKTDKNIWFRKYDMGWPDWERFATATDLPNSTTNNPSQGAYSVNLKPCLIRAWLFMYRKGTQWEQQKTTKNILIRLIFSKIDIR